MGSAALNPSSCSRENVLDMFLKEAYPRDMPLPPINVNLGNVGLIAEPISKFVDVVAKATGIGPLGTVLQAKAEARAKKIATEVDIHNTELLARAQLRLDHLAAVRQFNIEKVIALAKDELPDEVSAASVDDDWIMQFFGHAQDVCDEQMQDLWARILAGEVAKPRSYAKRTLQFLKTFDKDDAVKFSGLCSFVIYELPSGWPMIFQDEQTERELQQKIGGYVNHFINIGLIGEPLIRPISSLTGTKIWHFGSTYVFDGPAPPDTRKFEMVFGQRALSQTGQQLARVANPTPVDGYIGGLSTELSKLGTSLRKVE
jgi:hypothetical protein